MQNELRLGDYDVRNRMAKFCEAFNGCFGDFASDIKCCCENNVLTSFFETQSPCVS